MTTHDALIRAICAHPDDDTPRLIFADFLEESGEPERAAFVRAQVELARTPAWEPFAVFCRHRRPEWHTGTPFRHTLPALPGGWTLDWHEEPFRRGFGWRVNARSIPAWLDLAPRLFEQAPIGELHLWASTLDDWRRFGAADWVRHLRAVHFEGATAVEPVRMLCATPAATGIRDIHFHRASSAGLPELVEDLLQTPLGKGLRGLHFHAGYQSLGPLVEAIGTGRLERLSFAVMGLSGELLEQLCQTLVAANLTELAVRADRLGGDGVRELVNNLPTTALHTLVLSDVELGPDGMEALAGNERLSSVRRLDLTRNPLTPRGFKRLTQSKSLAGLRSLNLTRSIVDLKGLRHLTRAKFWPNLVELDLRGNNITGPGVRQLLDAEMPTDLTALLIDADRIGEASRAALRKKFGDAVVFTRGEPA